MSKIFNIYDCENGHEVVTLNIHEGVTPMFMNCPKCKKLGHHKVKCTSRWFDVPQDFSLQPDIEWFKPTREQIKKLDPVSRDHVKKGGLMDRPAYKTGHALWHPEYGEWVYFFKYLSATEFLCSLKQFHDPKTGEFIDEMYKAKFEASEDFYKYDRSELRRKRT